MNKISNSQYCCWLLSIDKTHWSARKRCKIISHHIAEPWRDLLYKTWWCDGESRWSKSLVWQARMCQTCTPSNFTAFPWWCHRRRNGKGGTVCLFWQMTKTEDLTILFFERKCLLVHSLSHQIERRGWSAVFLFWIYLFKLKKNSNQNISFLRHKLDSEWILKIAGVKLTHKDVMIGVLFA